ncbi:Uncharacterized conserved protein YjiS, DUF1127 family [Roseovarius pacificus]|uniref:Uncharacterized conserved protein YjiS, DUF1127 family n=1 Tax=Roseovarius pacificus TaxID=337701 RepID=A0A1M7F308_9RHOB|nr:DUF1127 domain-containing protein [Roseovarius pacificus]GGO58738.1 hypothetical protein GCM10011315_29120 [Roseovarius pacificus]SHL98108.1 Uncharacterized conserved protein YjiS, DUF1127 family [Roseovarius pacificus]
MAAIVSTQSHAGGFRHAVARLLNAVRAWNDARVTRAALSQLTDRELDDIGLSRSDIQSVSRSV